MSTSICLVVALWSPVRRPTSEEIHAQRCSQITTPTTTKATLAEVWEVARTRLAHRFGCKVNCSFDDPVFENSTGAACLADDTVGDIFPRDGPPVDKVLVVRSAAVKRTTPMQEEDGTPKKRSAPLPYESPSQQHKKIKVQHAIEDDAASVAHAASSPLETVDRGTSPIPILPTPDSENVLEQNPSSSIPPPISQLSVDPTQTSQWQPTSAQRQRSESVAAAETSSVAAAVPSSILGSGKNPLTGLGRSLTTPSSSAAKVSAAAHWSAEEDRVLLEGLAKGWSAAKIMATNKLSRSKAAVRNRHRQLKTKQSAPSLVSSSAIRSSPLVAPSIRNAKTKRAQSPEVVILVPSSQTQPMRSVRSSGPLQLAGSKSQQATLNFNSYQPTSEIEWLTSKTPSGNQMPLSTEETLPQTGHAACAIVSPAAPSSSRRALHEQEVAMQQKEIVDIEMSAEHLEESKPYGHTTSDERAARAKVLATGQYPEPWLRQDLKHSKHFFRAYQDRQDDKVQKLRRIENKYKYLRLVELGLREPINRRPQPERLNGPEDEEADEEFDRYSLRSVSTYDDCSDFQDELDTACRVAERSARAGETDQDADDYDSDSSLEDRLVYQEAEARDRAERALLREAENLNSGPASATQSVADESDGEEIKPELSDASLIMPPPPGMTDESDREETESGPSPATLLMPPPPPPPGRVKQEPKPLASGRALQTRRVRFESLPTDILTTLPAAVQESSTEQSFSMPSLIEQLPVGSEPTTPQVNLPSATSPQVEPDPAPVHESEVAPVQESEVAAVQGSEVAPSIVHCDLAEDPKLKRARRRARRRANSKRKRDSMDTTLLSNV